MMKRGQNLSKWEAKTTGEQACRRQLLREHSWRFPPEGKLPPGEKRVPAVPLMCGPGYGDTGKQGMGRKYEVHTWKESDVQFISQLLGGCLEQSGK